MLIVGSVALGTRKPKDLDIICYKADVPFIEKLFNTVTRFDKNEFKTLLKDSGGRQIECMLADELEGFQALLRPYKESKIKTLSVCTYLDLYFLKKSHIYRPINWFKHIEDYHVLKGYLEKDFSYAFLVSEKNLMSRLKADQDKIHGKKLKTPNLNKSKESFFNDKVVKIFEHDDIHSIMAHKELPMYTYMQKEGTEVICDKTLWEKFTQIEKMQCVLEESYVIALERKVLPNIFLGHKTYTNKEAFDWALMRICTTLCRGWFREFAVENYKDIQSLYNEDYVTKFLTAYSKKKITRIDK